MTCIVGNAKAARAELEALKRAGAAPEGLHWRKHPDAAAAALIVESFTREADQTARELERKHGRRYWYSGQWRTKREQLAFRFAATP